MAAPLLLFSVKRQFCPYTTNYAYYTFGCLFVHLFLGVLDGHAAFTILLRLDASLAIAPCALHLGNPTTPDAPPVLRPKPKNLPALWF